MHVYIHPRFHMQDVTVSSAVEPDVTGVLGNADLERRVTKSQALLELILLSPSTGQQAV